MFQALGKSLARFLSRPRGRGVQFATSGQVELAAALKKGDVLLLEGNSRISSVIKYLTSRVGPMRLCLSEMQLANVVAFDMIFSFVFHQWFPDGLPRVFHAVVVSG